MTLSTGVTALEAVTPLRVPRWRLFVGFALGVALLVLLARISDLEELGRALSLAPTRFGDLALVAFVYSSAFLLRAFAWRLLLVTQVSPVRLFVVLQAALFSNHLLPFKAGELLRPYLAARHGLTFGEAATTTIVARSFDVVALALIAVASLTLAGIGGAVVAAAVLAMAVTLAVIATAVVLLSRPSRLPAFAQPTAFRVREILVALPPRNVVLAFLLVSLSWLLEGVVVLGAAALLGIELSWSLALAATAFTVLLQVVHVTPGGIGMYEASMAGVLLLGGIPAGGAVTLALLTHGFKFAYSFSVGLVCAAFAASAILGRPRSGRAALPRRASSVEIAMARVWNVLNEGKPFTPVFAFGIVLLLNLTRLGDPAFLRDASVALIALTPLAVLFWRFDFPLRLRAVLWVDLAAFLLLSQFISLPTIITVLGVYVLFTVFFWGTLYYHLRIGTAWTNFLRFWRLVLENPDPTSGNLQEQLPKVLMLVLGFEWLTRGATWSAAGSVVAFTIGVGVTAAFAHQWFFTWVPALPQALPATRAATPRISRKVIVVAIDGCRADRLQEAHTPFIDRLRAEGTEYTNMATVYPARTVTAFSSMLTGASPKVHGMRSNFVPSLGVKCESLFTVLRAAGMKGRLVGIAHLIDAFGHEDVRSVSAVMHNDEIDGALVARAKEVLESEDPDLLVLQLLSVDQTGHARGSYHDEYSRKIEATDRIIQEFVGWCRTKGFLDEATLLLTSDHGQGIGIGGHGHMTPSEITVPCILWGAGVSVGRSYGEQRFLTDVAPTISQYLGISVPARSVGVPLQPAADAARPLVFVIPAFNEAERIAGVLDGVHAAQPEARIVVVDDGSSDATAELARAHGADVVRHPRNEGLGAALRSGFLRARQLDALVAVYLDADAEYDPAEATRLLRPIEAGEADYVLGSRFKGTIDGMPARRRFANHVFSLLLSVACGRRISDGQTGFRALSRRALDVAEIVHDYNYAQVLTMDLLRKGMRLREVPISYRRRRSGRSFITARYLWRVPLGMAREMLSD